MKTSIINLYFVKKKKILFEYITLISDMINMNDKKLWSKKRDSHNLIKAILDKFVDNYIYSNDINEEYILKYINYNTKINNSVNLVVMSIIDYYKEQKNESKLKESRDELLLLAIVIGCAVELDNVTNAVARENIDIHYIRRKINEIIVEKSKFALYKNSKKNIKKLANMIKENNKIETQIYDEINSLNINNYFIRYSDQSNYYLIKYKYDIEKLKDYNKYDVEVVKTKNDIDTQMKLFAYNKLAITVLRSLISKDNNYYVIAFDKSLMNSIIFNRVSKIFNNLFIKKKIRLLVKYEDLEKYKDIIEEKGYLIIIDYNEIGNINDRIFVDDSEILIKEEFLKNNEFNIERFKARNIKFQIKREFDIYEEETIVKELS